MFSGGHTILHSFQEHRRLLIFHSFDKACFCFLFCLLGWSLPGEHEVTSHYVLMTNSHTVMCFLTYVIWSHLLQPVLNWVTSLLLEFKIPSCSLATVKVHNLKISTQSSQSCDVNVFFYFMFRNVIPNAVVGGMSFERYCEGPTTVYAFLLSWKMLHAKHCVGRKSWTFTVMHADTFILNFLDFKYLRNISGVFVHYSICGILLSRYHMLSWYPASFVKRPFFLHTMFLSATPNSIWP